jgi:hypothetical protein
MPGIKLKDFLELGSTEGVNNRTSTIWWLNLN